MILLGLFASGAAFGAGFVLGSRRVTQETSIQSSTERHIVLFGDSNLYFCERTGLLGKLWEYFSLPNLPLADYLKSLTGLPTIMIPSHNLRTTWENRELVRTLFQSFHGKVDVVITIGQNDIPRFTARHQTGLAQMKTDFALYLESRFKDLHSLFCFEHLDIRIVHIAPFEDESLEYSDAYLACFQILHEKVMSYPNTVVVGPFDAFLPDRWHLRAEARYKFAVELARVIT